MTNCIFCKIAKREIPSTKIYEDKDILAFLDINPANKGHTLVIPKEHHEILTDLPDDLLCKLVIATKKIAKAIKESLNADGFNTFMNNKKVAGQIVPHAHFHIVPRFENDGIKFDWPTRKYEDGEVEDYKDKIAAALK